MISVSQLLASLGAAVLLKTAYSLLSFLALYIRPPAYHRYLYGSSPYALISGASDGIGKAVAKELYLKGFNLILHGRNEEKLRKVCEEIRANGSGSRDVKMWIADADAPDTDFAAAVAQWEGLQISLVVNNVGGSPPRLVPYVFVTSLMHMHLVYATCNPEWTKSRRTSSWLLCAEMPCSLFG